MNCSYYNLRTKRHTEEWPLHYDEVWAPVKDAGRYVFTKMMIHDNGFHIKIDAFYSFCCGLREVGEVWFTRDNTNVPAVREALIKKLENSFPFECVGALTYTIVKDNYGRWNHSDEVVKFITEWPGASAGEWFYNPNSGNTVQQWTLPINQHMKPEEVEEESEEVYDDED